MRELIVHHHLGLGDHIICNGLINWLIDHKKIKKLFLITKKANIETVKHLYEDSDVVTIVEFDEAVHEEHQFSGKLSYSTGVPLLKISFSGSGLFDQHFYDSIDIPFESRWTHFKLPSNLERARMLYQEVKDSALGEYCLVSSNSSIGNFNITINTKLPIIFAHNKTNSLIDWVNVIQGASEIHCIDSSFIHLADSLKLGGKKLFYHDVGRLSQFQLKNDWKQVT